MIDRHMEIMVWSKTKDLLTLQTHSCTHIQDTAKHNAINNQACSGLCRSLKRNTKRWSALKWIPYSNFSFWGYFILVKHQKTFFMEITIKGVSCSIYGAIHSYFPFSISLHFIHLCHPDASYSPQENDGGGTLSI